MESKNASKKNAANGTIPKRWNAEAVTREGQICTNLRDDLHELARVFARHERCETVVVRHVEHAFVSLSSLGLARKSFWMKPDFWASVGGVLIGVSLAVPDWLNLLPGVGAFVSEYAKLIAGISFVGGLAITATARFKACRPSPP